MIHRKKQNEQHLFFVNPQGLPIQVGLWTSSGISLLDKVPVKTHLEEHHPDEPFSHFSWHAIVAAVMGTTARAGLVKIGFITEPDKK